MFEKIISKLSIKNKVGGNIAYYNLTDWWLSDFTEDERNMIREKYKPVGCGKDYCIDKGVLEPIYNTCSQYNFLNNIYIWFAYEQDYNLYIKVSIKIYNKMQEYNPTNYNDKSDIIGRNIYYLEQIKFHYANRQKDNHLELAIEYCKKQIDISKEVKQAWFIQNGHALHLPSHIGFKQLAIIYEKQGKYKEALDITKEALLEGWNNDSQKRIDRLEKKINKN